MHGGDARKDERKAAASCARETVSPYDLGTPLPRDYPYDPRGRRLADGALAKTSHHKNCRQDSYTP